MHPQAAATATPMPAPLIPDRNPDDIPDCVMKRILVVCTGNVCRTPMAKALIEREIGRAGLDDRVSVDSAGTYALVGGGASGGSVQAMADRGLDISEHLGKQITAELVAQADLILVMEERHRRQIFVTWPRALAKTFLLGEMAGEHADVADPYGMDQLEYDKAASIIESYVRRGMPQMLRRLGFEPVG